MKLSDKKIPYFFFWITCVAVFCACDQENKTLESEKASEIEEVYYCPQDTGVTGKKPGVCMKCKKELVKKDKSRNDTIYYCRMCTGQEQREPGLCKICQMDLEKKWDSVKVHSGSAYDVIVNPVNASVLSHIKTIHAVSKEVDFKIRTFGNITYDPGRIYDVPAKAGGRIEDLYVKYVYEYVQKGSPLFKIFSHQLLSAQQEYLFIKNNGGKDESLLKAAEKKLLLLGMTNSQIRQLTNGSHVHPATTVYSPYTGYVIDKTVADLLNKNYSKNMDKGEEKMQSASMPEEASQNKLSLREGDYVSQGESVFKIANTDIVWGVFEVFSDDIGLIKKGLPLTFKVQNTEDVFTGKIDFVEPFYRAGKKTVRFRVYIPTKNKHLKIGNLLEGNVNAGMKKGLWLPQSAIIDLGREKVVFVKEEGVFQTRKVVTGFTSDNRVEIISGVNPVDNVAENAQYLVDSESFIKVRE